jgi:transposase
VFDVPELEVSPLRVSTAFSRLLCLAGVWVRSVKFEPGRVVVTVVLRRRRLQCPKCSYLTWNRENKQHHDSTWRHLDLGVWQLEVHARLRRLRCPEHGAHVEGVPFARDGARFTRDFDDLTVRHEALLNCVGCRSPPPDCRSSSVKRGAA